MQNQIKILLILILIIKKIIDFIKKRDQLLIYISIRCRVLTLGYLNTKFKLPGTSLKLAKILTDKFKIRTILKKNNFHQPKFFLINKDFNKKKFLNKKNFLVKPLDSSGSRGIYEIKNSKNLDIIIKKSLKFSKKKKLY